MPGMPRTRLAKLIEREETVGYLTEAERATKKKLEKRLAEREKKRRVQREKVGVQRDNVEQVGGGLVVCETDDDKMAELVPHKEVWERLWVDPQHGGGLIPFKKSFWQLELDEMIRIRRRKRKPVRLIIVKGRQLQTTTGTASTLYSEMAASPGVPALAVTYKKGLDAVLPIATTYRTFIESDPWFAEAEPQAYSVNKWVGANGSSIQFQVAGEALARGPHYRFLHGTEVDFWPDFDATVKGMMPSISKHWLSIVILETTLGDRPSPGLRNLIARVVEGKSTEWEVWFQAWWRHPNYRAGHESNTFDWSPEIAAEVRKTLTPREHELLELGAPLDAIEWRRKIIDIDCFGNEDTFAQEYPATLEEALEFRGSWFFQRAALKWHSKNEADCNVRQKIWCEDKEWFITPARSTHEPHLRVWQEPHMDKRYRLGADVAASEDLSAARSDLTILDVETGKVCARWWGNVPAHKFGQVIHAAAMYYGGSACEVMFDRTGVGAAVIGELERLGTPNVALGNKNKAGFAFSTEVRERILGTVQQLVDSCAIWTPCAEQLRQLRSFTGETKNAGWCDAVVSLGLACYRLPESDDWLPKLPADEEPPPPKRVGLYMTLAEHQQALEMEKRAREGSNRDGWLYNYS